MDNKNLLENILENFEYSLKNIQNFDLGYRITRFITNKIELLTYSTRTKDFIFYIDENKVENFISVYKAVDKFDNSKWIIIELIIWESKQKEIFFFQDKKLFLITENKWWKIIKSQILEDNYKINKILKILNNDLEFLREKVRLYKNKLKYRWYLKKQVSEKVVNNFRLNFLNNQLQTS